MNPRTEIALRSQKVGNLAPVLWSALDSEIEGIYKNSLKKIANCSMQSSQSPSQSVIKRYGLNGYGAIEILHNHYYYYF